MTSADEPEDRASSLPAGLHAYPGVVAVIDTDGIIVSASGQLCAEAARTVIGEPFAALLDRDASRDKFERLLSGLIPGSGAPRAHRWELILDLPGGRREPRVFVPVVDPDDRRVWLIEQMPDPRLDALRAAVDDVNADLVGAQRELMKERARLAVTLDDLNAQYARAEALSAELQAANDELRARGRELERSNEALDDFAHVVSHDLKAPLRAIDRYAEFILEDAGDVLAGESRVHLLRLRDRATALSAMVEGVLRYARAGRVQSPVEDIDVAHLIAHIVDLVAPEHASRVVVRAEPPDLRTERAPLQQVLTNLISNAIRHADPDRPAVEVRARRDMGVAEFTVRDNGPGIPPSHRDRVWSLFSTGTDESAETGSGIGLAIVRKLVESRGGTVRIVDAPGGGAVFRFTWPAPDPR